MCDSTAIPKCSCLVFPDNSLSNGNGWVGVSGLKAQPHRKKYAVNLQINLVTRNGYFM